MKTIATLLTSIVLLFTIQGLAQDPESKSNFHELVLSPETTVWAIIGLKQNRCYVSNPANRVLT